jgi:hypothetical protein
MKKNVCYPSFEFLFSLGIIALLVLPPLVMAQNQLELKVTIQNNDTTINGKNIKALSAAEHKSALKDISEMGSNVHNKAIKSKSLIYFFRKNK